MAAFPAFHVLWALIAAECIERDRRQLRLAAWAWATAIALSCLTTGMHSMADVAAGILVFIPLRRYDRVWLRVRSLTERLANSWREWHIGPVRIISHALFAGLAGAVVFGSMAVFASEIPLGVIAGFALAGVIGAGLWAQLLESSSGLLRPFGYYGSFMGVLFAAAVVRAAGVDAMLILGAVAIGAPWVQAIGRLRCLVQGCCHGDVTSERIGIRYRHPRSRVSYLAGLAGQPLHATPLYSIAANILLGLLILRLWTVHAPAALLVGVYMIGNGLARFVEEGFRGEPQTAIIARLRLYQWLAAGSVAIGAVFTILPAQPVPPASIRFSAAALLGTLAFGALTAFAMGIDFPHSNRRFSRLAG
jgi:hypothetical protein